MSTTNNEHHVDQLRQLTIGAARAGGGWWLTEAVDRDGATRFWLIAEDSADGDGPVPPAPEHEQLGALGREHRLRLGLRCPAIRRNGRQCRNTVPGFGDYCAAHREAVEA